MTACRGTTWLALALLAALTAAWPADVPAATSAVAKPNAPDLGRPLASFRSVYEHGKGRLEEDLRIGSPEVDDPSFFLLPIAVCPDSRGNIFVLDSKRHEILKFGPDGTHLLSFSRSGEGPGELGAVYQMTVDAQDRVIVWDHMYHRFTVFDDDGEYVKTVPFQPEVQQLEAAVTGSVFAGVRQIDTTRFPRETQVKILRFSPDLEHFVPVDSASVVDTKVIRRRDASLFIQLAFSETLLWSVTPDGGLVIGYSGEYRLRKLTPQLGLEREIRRKSRRLPVTQDDRELYYGRLQQNPSTPIQLIRSEVHLPGEKPCFSGIYVDPEGYILVELYDEVEDGALYDVFTPAGEHFARAILPYLGSVTMRDGFLYQVARFGDDQLVVRYRLVADEG